MSLRASDEEERLHFRRPRNVRSRLALRPLLNRWAAWRAWVRGPRGRPLEAVVFGVVDLETTGLSARRDRILEVGLVVQRGEDALDRFSSLVDPGVEIPGLVTELTGLAGADVRGAPDEATALRGLAALLEKHGVEVLVAHNARFDAAFLTAAWRTHGIRPPLPPFLCSLRLARVLLPGPGYGLDALVRRLGIPLEPRHRALGDAAMTARLWWEILRRAHRRGVRTAGELRRLERRGRARRPRRATRAVDGPIGIR